MYYIYIYITSIEHNNYNNYMYVEISDGNKQQNILVQKLSRTFQKIIVSTLVKFAKACLIIIAVYFHLKFLNTYCL